MTQFNVAELFEIMLTGQTHQVEKPWGTERILATDHFLIKVITVSHDHHTSLQHHVEKREIHWIMGGSGTIQGTPDADLDRPRPSGGYLVEPGQVHRAIGPLLILEISTNHPDDVIRHEDSYGRAQ